MYLNRNKPVVTETNAPSIFCKFITVDASQTACKPIWSVFDSSQSFETFQRY